MRLSFLGWHTWRYWFFDWTLKRPRVIQWNHVSRHTRNGVDWVLRIGPLMLTRYATCTCVDNAR